MVSVNVSRRGEQLRISLEREDILEEVRTLDVSTCIGFDMYVAFKVDGLLVISYMRGPVVLKW